VDEASVDAATRIGAIKQCRAVAVGCHRADSAAVVIAKLLPPLVMCMKAR
jgi:hypothetical protein